MSETETLTRDPAAAIAPAGVVPTPRPAPEPTGPAPIDLPDGSDPAADALVLLNRTCRDAPSILAGRIDRLSGEIDAQVEEYRLDAKLTLGEFIAHAARRVRLRRVLAARAGTPAETSVAAEVLSLIRAIRRWKPAHELKAERARIIDRLRGELGSVEGAIRSTVEAARQGAGFAGGDREAEQLGLGHDHDEVLRRLTAALATRQALKARLARLDPTGDEGRAQAVGSAIEAIGGTEALVGALAPTLGSAAADELGKVLRQIADGSLRLESIDPETRRHAEASGRLDALKARVGELKALAEEQRAEAAAALVSSALGGSLAAIQALESALGGIRPELAEALDGIRGDDPALVATVAEMIG